MKKYKILLSAAVSALMLASCAKESGQEPQAPSAITIEASIGAHTKSMPIEDKRSFAAEDKISVYAWMGSAAEVPQKKVVDGVVNTFDGSKWAPETQMLWSYQKENHYFLAVYPAKYISNFTADEWPLGDDLLIATELEGIPFQENPEPVALAFTHALARLDVNLRFRNQWDAVPENVSVRTQAKYQYTVNYLTKAVTATGNDSYIPVAQIATVQGHHSSFSGIQVPQDGMTTVSVSVDSKDFVYTAAEPIPLESGKVTTLNLYVGLDKIELGSVTVTPWAEGASVQGGEALVPVSGISFKEGTATTVDLGNTFQLTPIFAPEGATEVDCTWNSLNPEIATVDENGLITAKGRGVATIECLCMNAKAQFVLTVNGLTPVYSAPTAKAGLTYNGSAKALVNAGSVTSEGLSMSYSLDQNQWSGSVPSATNAGTYKVYWRIIGNSTYNDASGNVSASIAKASASLSVSTASVSFSADENTNSTKTFTVTYTGDGQLSVQSSNSSLATAAISGTTVTVTRKSGDGGSCTITVKAAAGTNYAAASNKTVTVSLTSSDPGTYLQNAVAGDKVGSNGKVYKPKATMPTGVTVVGCVVRPGLVFKATDEPGHLTGSQLYNYKVSAGKFHYHSMNDLWDRYWEIYSVYLYNQILIDKDNTGQSQATATAALNQVNSYLQAAGCDPINVNRYYGTSNGWFYMPKNFDWQNDPDWWHDNLNYTISARAAFTYDTN